MKRFVLFSLMILGWLFAGAQESVTSQSGQQQSKEEITPEKMASREIRQMKKILTLTEEQYSKLYDACLKTKKDIKALQQNASMGRSMGFGGPMGGGFGGPMGGFGPMGGDMQNSQSATLLKKQIERCQKSLDKKYKKIMGEEAYQKWTAYQAEQLAKQQQSTPQAPTEAQPVAQP